MEPAKLGNSRSRQIYRTATPPVVRERGPRKFQTASDSSERQRARRLAKIAKIANPNQVQTAHGEPAMDRSVLLGLLMVSSTAMGAEKMRLADRPTGPAAIRNSPLPGNYQEMRGA